MGLRGNLRALRKPRTSELAENGVPAVRLRSLSVLLVVWTISSGSSPPSRQSCVRSPALIGESAAGNDPRDGRLLGLTLAAEIGEVAASRAPAKLISYAGLAPTIEQSGQSSWTGRISKADRRRCAGQRSRQHQPAWRPTKPVAPALTDTKTPTRQANPAKAAVARRVLIASWHVLARQQPFKPRTTVSRRNPPRQAPRDLAARRPTATEKPGQLKPTICAAERRKRTRTP